ncbi:MAG: hypothetical protein U0228_07085 [Myxococcaceae bacterium]
MNKTLVAVAVVVVFAGCRKDQFTVEKIDPGSECAAGGVRLISPDQTTEVICNGTNGTNGSNGSNGGDGMNGGNGSNGAVSLVTQAPIPNDDQRCPTGGVVITSGLDNGADGGIAGNQALEASEVTDTQIVCNGDDGAVLGSLVAPGGDAGTNVLQANGGAGSLRNGGSGGSVTVGFNRGSNGGHLKVWRTGHADATRPAPTVPAAELGATPLNITGNTTLTFEQLPDALDAGTPYLTGSGIAIARGAGMTPSTVTSLTVAAGATLTLPPTFVGVDRSCRFAGSVVITGANGSAVFNCADVVFATGSSVRATAPISFTVNAADGDLVHQGTIDCTPTTNTNGASVSLNARRNLFMNGVVRANAGAGDDGFRGGLVSLTAGGDLVAAGSIEANGNDAVTPGSGGAGGEVRLDNTVGGLFGRGGMVYSSVAISAKGGNLSGSFGACEGGCTGGSGGYVNLRTTATVVDGRWNVSGGSGSFGGTGGTAVVQIGLSTYNGGLSAGSLISSVSVNASAGAGDSGGNGGSVQFMAESGLSVGAEIVLLGYSGLEANGGAGQTSAGGGGSIHFYQGSRSELPGGAVVNQADLSVNGGDCVNGSGANGGSLNLTTQSGVWIPRRTWERTTNNGVLRASGGRGLTGGVGGSINVYGLHGATNTGDADARGGLGVTFGGGSGGSVSLQGALGALTNNGKLDVTGGVAGGGPVMQPAPGGELSLTATHVVNGGVLVAKGGAGDLQTGFGGNGGRVFIESQDSASTVTVAMPAGIDVRAGAGATAGMPGIVTIDGFLATDAWTH